MDYRKKPVFFESEQEIRDAWKTAFTTAAAIGAVVFLVWGLL